MLFVDCYSALIRVGQPDGERSQSEVDVHFGVAIPPKKGDIVF